MWTLGYALSAQAFQGETFKGLRSWSSEKGSGSLLTPLAPDRGPGSHLCHWVTAPRQSVSNANHILLLPPSQGPHGPQTEIKSRSWPALQDSQAPALPALQQPGSSVPSGRSLSLGHSGPFLAQASACTILLIWNPLGPVNSLLPPRCGGKAGWDGQRGSTSSASSGSFRPLVRTGIVNNEADPRWTPGLTPRPSVRTGTMNNTADPSWTSGLNTRPSVRTWTMNNTADPSWIPGLNPDPLSEQGPWTMKLIPGGHLALPPDPQSEQGLWTIRLIPAGHLALSPELSCTTKLMESVNVSKAAAAAAADSRKERGWGGGEHPHLLSTYYVCCCDVHSWAVSVTSYGKPGMNSLATTIFSHMLFQLVFTAT